jgi:hypothetical protein
VVSTRVIILRVGQWLAWRGLLRWLAWWRLAPLKQLIEVVVVNILGSFLDGEIVDAVEAECRRQSQDQRSGLKPGGQNLRQRCNNHQTVSG